MGVALKKIELVGARAYSYKGDQYHQNTHYMVKPDRAKLLLRLQSDYGFKVFKEVGVRLAPVVEQPQGTPEGKARVIDTTKSKEEQFEDELLAEAVEADAGKPIVDTTEEAGTDDGGTEV